MALPPTPSGVIRFHLNHSTTEDSLISCRFDQAYTGSAPDTAVLNLMAGHAGAAWGTALAPMLSSAYHLDHITAVDLANPSTVEGIFNGPVAGSRSGATLPTQVAALLVFTVQRRYRGSRPKMFTPYGTDSDLNDVSHWNSAFISAFLTAWTSFQGDLAGYSTAGTTLQSQVAVSYFSGKTANPNPNSRSRFVPTPRATPLVMPVNVYSVPSVLGTQRRRLRAAP